MTDDRIHRAVPLRADEAAYLAREAGNRGSKPCCPHLDVFHNEGSTCYGGRWRACDVWGCGCCEEDPPPAVQVANSRAQDAIARRDLVTTSIAWFFIGGVASFMAIVIALWLRGTP